MNRLLVVIGLVLLAVGNLYAEVLWEENFDGVANWSSTQTQSKAGACGGEDHIVWGSSCSTDCPPPVTTTTHSGLDTWDLGYYTSSMYCDNPGNQTYQVTSNDARGGTGKSLEHWLEAENDWRGGRLYIRFQESSDVYIRFYVKYSSSFVWSDGTGHGYQKFLSVSSFPYDVGSLAPDTGRGSAFWHSPDFIWQMYAPIVMGSPYQNARINPEPRDAPGYQNHDDSLGDDDVYTINPLVNAWHCVEIRLALNSVADAADGVTQIWWDGNLVYSRTDWIWVYETPWQTAHSYIGSADDSTQTVVPAGTMKGFRPLANHTSGGSEPNWASATTIGDIVTDGNSNQWEYFTDWKWNTFWLFDNHSIGVGTPVEEVMYADDIVISTTYVGTDYVIGGGSTQTGMSSGVSSGKGISFP